jgi:hypothetical protein
MPTNGDNGTTFGARDEEDDDRSGAESGRGINHFGSNGSGPDPGIVRPSIKLGQLVEASGAPAPENFPQATYEWDPRNLPGGGRAILGLPGRFLLRLINVLPEQCPPEERTKFYLLAATVLLNAFVAAFTVPVGMSVAYPGLHGIILAGLALLGAGIVGVMDALIVGHWLSAAKYRLNPPEDPPPLPGPLRRFGIFIPRLAFTGIIVFSLGLLLTLSANTGVIAKQAQLDAIKDRNTAIATAQALDDQTIATDQTELMTAQVQLRRAQNRQAADSNRASCEAYGRPRVPKCSLHPGMGKIYHSFLNKANGSDQAAVRSAQTQVHSVSVELDSARTHKRHQLTGKNITVAAHVATGLSAVRAEWNEYANSHGFDWLDRHMMELLVLGVDVVPLGMKLFGGVSSFEVIAWEHEWDGAVATRRRRRAEHKRLAVDEELYSGAADMWRDTRLRKIAAWLDADADDPGEIPQMQTAGSQPGRVPEDPARPDSAWPPTVSPGTWRPEEGADPVRERRDAVVGDVVRLASGQYKLLSEITTRESNNGDVFIAALIKYTDQVSAIRRENPPVRALKFTRTDDQPLPAEFDFINRFPAPGETLLRSQPLATANYGRLIYESQYFPRSDVMRYLYGEPRERYPSVSVGQVIEIMLSVNDAHGRIWEEGFLHNDTRLRNLIMSGPLEDGRYNADALTPRVRVAGQVMLCDWGSLSYVGQPIDDEVGVTASILEGDPAVMRELLGIEGQTDPGQSPLSFASDAYGTFACAYQLLTGGIAPTVGQLVYHYDNDPYEVARLENATLDELTRETLNGWPDALGEDPMPVRSLNPDLPSSLADLIDSGLRARPGERLPAAIGARPALRARDVAGAIREAIEQMAADLTKAELEQPLPGRHGDYLWQLDAPIGWPPEVLQYVAQHWPEYGVEA